MQQTKQKNKILTALIAAFPHTLPIMAGFLFLGITYGVYMHSKGFSFLYPMLMSMTIFAGSMEFAAVNLLLGSFNPIQAVFMTIIVNARHLFYGLSLLEKYKGTGIKKVYLIFGLCDESFSINCSLNPPQNVDKGWFMFFITLLNQLYWIIGATLGGIFGMLISFNTKGLEFAMTAMFVVIFLENWLKEKNHISSVIGVIIPAALIVLLGAENYIIASMAAILIVLTLLRPYLTKKRVKV